MDDSQTETRASYRVVPHAKIRISVVKGPDTGVSVEIAGTALRVGTAPENDLVLTDQTVSRQHCELEPTSFGVRIRDRGSRNGIELSGSRIYDAIVPGDFRIGLGDTLLTVTRSNEMVQKAQTESDRFGYVLGRSPRMRELFAELERIAAVEHTLLIEGETGTGKDLIAESVHEKSRRAGLPFVVFDCGAVAKNLIESELFGHERGAFTGAHATHRGVFEQAQGGTLFLDEIGELPLDLQPKLLRALERREIRRVGGTRTIGVDVRILAATNRNLRSEMQNQRFRQDLYFRLAQAQVSVPPLREREGDLELLIEHFLAQEQPPGRLDDVPESVWEMFRKHRWPGNVRELKNAVHRLVVTPERVITAITRTNPESAFASQNELLPLSVARRQNSDAFERAYVTRALELGGQNVPRAADLAGVSRQMMLRLVNKHSLR